jgi:hypothetical protein
MSTVTVDDTAYPTNPQVVVEFDGVPKLTRVSGTPDVLFSFDGTNDHGRLVVTTIPQQTTRKAYRRVWLRLATAGTADVEVAHETR